MINFKESHLLHFSVLIALLTVTFGQKRNIPRCNPSIHRQDPGCDGDLVGGQFAVPSGLRPLGGAYNFSDRLFGAWIQSEVSFRMVPRNQSVDESYSLVQFNCEVASSGRKPSYLWFKDHRIINSSPEFQGRFRVFPNGSLQIQNIKRSDAGQFTCLPLLSINAGMNSVDSDASMYNTISAHLEVHSPPIASMGEDDSLYLGLGEARRLPCVLQSHDKIKQVEWRKTGQITEIARKIGQKPLWHVSTAAEKLKSTRSYAQKETHYWYDLAAELSDHSGMYQCRGRNRLGWSNWSELKAVLVAELPRFSSLPPSQNRIALNQPVTLTCQATSRLDVKVDWYTSLYNTRQLRQQATEDFEEVAPEPHIFDQQTSKWTHITSEVIYLVSGQIRSDGVLLEASSCADGTLNLKLASLEVRSREEFLFYCVASNKVGRVVATSKVWIDPDQGKTGSHSRGGSGLLLVEVGQFEARIARNSLQTRLMDKESSDQDSCIRTLYYMAIRSNEDWISVSVQSDDQVEVSVTGLLPDDLYAFRMRLWCNAPSPGSQTDEPVTLARTLPVLSRGKSDAKNQLAGKILPEATDEEAYTQCAQATRNVQKRPSKPTKLTLSIPLDQARLLQRSSSQVALSNHSSEFRLNWSFNRSALSSPTLAFRPEYRLLHCANILGSSSSGSGSRVKAVKPGQQKDSFRLFDWLTLAPVRWPRTSFVFSSGSRPHGSAVADNTHPTRVDHSRCQLLFRVRGYGLLSYSEPSESIAIGHPVAALLDTVAYEMELVTFWYQKSTARKELEKMISNKTASATQHKLQPRLKVFLIVITFALAVGIVTFCLVCCICGRCPLTGCPVSQKATASHTLSNPKMRKLPKVEARYSCSHHGESGHISRTSLPMELRHGLYERENSQNATEVSLYRHALPRWISERVEGGEYFSWNVLDGGLSSQAQADRPILNNNRLTPPMHLANEANQPFVENTLSVYCEKCALKSKESSKFTESGTMEHFSNITDKLKEWGCENDSPQKISQPHSKVCICSTTGILEYFPVSEELSCHPPDSDGGKSPIFKTIYV